MSAKRILLTRMRAAVAALRARAAQEPEGSVARAVVLECLQLVVAAFGGAIEEPATPARPQ